MSSDAIHPISVFTGNQVQEIYELFKRLAVGTWNAAGKFLKIVLLLIPGG